MNNHMLEFRYRIVTDQSDPYYRTARSVVIVTPEMFNHNTTPVNMEKELHEEYSYTMGNILSRAPMAIEVVSATRSLYIVQRAARGRWQRVKLWLRRKLGEPEEQVVFEDQPVPIPTISEESK